MDLSTWVMIVVLVWTVLGLILVAAIWSRMPVKAVMAWLGLTLLPLGVWLAGLSQAAIDGWNTIALWFQNLEYTMPQVIGLSVLGLSGVLLVGSRLVPNRRRRVKRTDSPEIVPGTYAGPVSSAGAAPDRSQSEQTLILPESRTNPQP